MTCFVIIPVFNENTSLPSLVKELIVKLEEIFGKNYAIILVDDGSYKPIVLSSITDNTQVSVITNSSNMGPGFAFRKGFSSISKLVQKEDIILTIEGDRTSSLEILSKMFHRLQEGYDMALASPIIFGGEYRNVAIWRRYLSELGNTLARRSLKLNGLWTLSSFYRMRSGTSFLAAQKFFGPEILSGDGFECMVEELMKYGTFTKKITEIPFVLDQSTRIGKSKMKVFRTIRGYVRVRQLGKKLDLI